LSPKRRAPDRNDKSRHQVVQIIRSVGADEIPPGSWLTFTTISKQRTTSLCCPRSDSDRAESSPIRAIQAFSPAPWAAVALLQPVPVPWAVVAQPVPVP
jgi:hypothetical protein